MVKKKTTKVSKLEKEIENLKLSKITNVLKDFTSQIDKLVSVSIALQSKNAELGMQMSDVLEEMNEMTRLLKEAGTSDVERKFDNIISELKKLNKSIDKLIKIELAKKIVIPKTGESYE